LIRSKVNYNDILIARVGNTIGKSCIFDKKTKALLSTTGVAKATIDTKIANVKFINAQMRLPQYIKYVWNQTEGGGQPYLNLKKSRRLDCYSQS
jgi:type I restriction enzyme, S subunit